MSDLALYRRLLRQARPYWLHLAVLLCIGLLASPVALLNPVPLKIVVDSVLGTRPLSPALQALLPAAIAESRGALLAAAVGLLLAVAALAQLQALTNKFMQAYVGERLVLSFRTQLVQQAQRLSLSYHDSKGAADSLYRIQQDAAVIDKIIVEGIIPFVTAAIKLGTMIAVTAQLDWQLVLVALAVSPPLFVLSRLYRPRMRRQHRHIKKLESSALAVVQETLGALRVVKAFGGEQRETDRFAQRSREGVAARIHIALTEGRYGLLVGLTTALGTGAVLFIGVRHVQANLLTLGQLLMAVTYLGQLYEPLKTVSKKAATLQSYLASAERAFALLDQHPEVPERPDARPLERARGATRQQIVAAAQAANAHEFIERLPQGYDTEVGERGMKLSGGQRQRVALARAFLKDSPILILDEPTSSVDAKTEAAIVEALERLKQGRTVIVISHRSTTLAGCSAFLTVDGGRVVAQTTPAPVVAVPVPPASPAPPARAPARAASVKRREILLAHPAVRAWQQLDPERVV